MATLKRVVYETKRGTIRHFFPASVRFGGLNPVLSIGETSEANGKETNVSQIPDLVDVTDDCAIRKGEEQPGMDKREQFAMRKLAKAQAKGEML
jgi:hypothetical protein